MLDPSGDSAQVQLPQGEMLVARPPQIDVRLNGICAIDFGTKSTIVVCRDGEARMLRIGQGDYSKAPTMSDFENPTVIELRDIANFLAAYHARNGRPFTEWNQVTVSHQAADAIFKDNSLGSSVYNSVFNELKQWAKDEQSQFTLMDLRGVIQEIKPYLETKEIDAGGFDPIELYAYYLGLYINNMHHQIYLDYVLSFPVNYKKEVREHIRKSFENGIKKSLPPALLRDEDMMKRFRVYLGASEPAAYAISALEGFNLEPKDLDKPVAYGVFDFGGGTTDFDFGIERVSENGRKCNFIIEQFGFNGDVLLGGENILELLAYEVYKDNIDVMRDKKIPFALPAGCETFAGAELVRRTKDASAHMNNRILAEKLRPIWENTAERNELTEKPLNVILFSNEKTDGAFTVSVNLNIDDAGNPTFPYYLGDAGSDGSTFTVRIDKQVKYGEWKYFTVADEPEFELYYTTAPRALQGNMTTAQVSMIHCYLDESDTTDDDDYGVYIKKVSPNQIEYAVGRDEDFAGDFNGKIYKQNL